MEKIWDEKFGMWRLRCDNRHTLHDSRRAEVTLMRDVRVKPEDVEHYEELPVDAIPAYTKAEYDAKVAELIRERYSADEEAAIKSKLLYTLLHPDAVTLDETGDDTQRPKEVAQFEEFYAWRLHCLELAKEAGLYNNDKTITNENI